MTPMEEAFHKHPYSWSFNVLTFFGQWNIKTDNKTKKIAYDFYRMFMVFYGFSIAFLGFIDLYQCKDNFDKAIFNMCTTTLTFGIAIKNCHVMLCSHKLDNLRLKLFAMSWSQKDPEEEIIKEHFLTIWLYHRRVFLLALIAIIPMWWITSLSSLVWGPRQLPFPVYLPLDLEDNFQYLCGFLYHMVGSFYIGNQVIHADLCMFSIMLQITTQFNILTKNVMDIDNIYCENVKYSKERESNSVLASMKTKQKLKECFKQQLTLVSYVKVLEDTYNKLMLLQLFCGLLLAIGNGLEIIMVTLTFSLKLSYQFCYLSIILGDLFMICTLSDLLKSQYQKLVFSLYDVPWYVMDNSCRKDLYLMTIGAQKYSHLTAGKMFHLDRKTFRGLMNNVYSWLALCRQVIMKK